MANLLNRLGFRFQRRDAALAAEAERLRLEQAVATQVRTISELTAAGDAAEVERAAACEAIERLSADKTRLERQLAAKLAKIETLASARNHWKRRSEEERARAHEEAGRLESALEMERHEAAEQARGRAEAERALKTLGGKIGELISRRSELKEQVRALAGERRALAGDLAAAKEARATAEREAADVKQELSLALEENNRLQNELGVSRIRVEQALAMAKAGVASVEVAAIDDEQGRRMAQAMREAGAAEGAPDMPFEMAVAEVAPGQAAWEAGRLLYQAASSVTAAADDPAAWAEFLAESTIRVPIDRDGELGERTPQEAVELLDRLALVRAFGRYAADGQDALSAACILASQPIWAAPPGGADAAARNIDGLLEAALAAVDSARGWRALAEQALAEDRLQLAAAASRRAVLLEPSELDGHVTRMAVLVRQGRLGLAAGHLIAAVERTDRAQTGARGRLMARYCSLAGRFAPERESGLLAVAHALATRQGREEAQAILVETAAEARTDYARRVLLEFCSERVGRARTHRSSRGAPPLVLISQIQRSGGTLLTRLLDGHPELLVHPYELNIGRPKKRSWPRLDLGEAPIELLSFLFEESIVDFIARGGYAKGDGNPFAAQDIKRFDFSIETLCERFLAQVKAPKTSREVLDAYLSSFFAAWESRGGLPVGRWLVGFAPRMIMDGLSLAGFLHDYPDGRIISCVRSPSSWYASEQRHNTECGSASQAAPLWLRSTRAALELAEARPQQTHLLTYEALVTDTERCMRRLAEQLGIAFDPVLLQPTFQGEPILPNSSFDISEYGVHTRSLDHSNLLSDESRADLNRVAAPLYEEACRKIDGVEKLSASTGPREQPARGG